MTRCAERFGEIFTLDLPTMGGKVVMTSNPDAIQQIFAASYEDVAQPKAREFATLLGATSLFVVEGSAHARLRRLVMPSLGPESVQRTLAEIQRQVEEAIDSWPLRVPFLLQEAMQALTLRSTVEGLLGRHSPRTEPLARAYSVASQAFASPLILIPIELQERLGFGPWTRLVRAAETARELAGDEVRERRAHPTEDGTDVLSRLLKARDPEGLPMTDGELSDTLVTLLVAGHDTTANALTWMFSCVLRDPSLHLQLKEELEQAREGGRLVPEKVVSLPLLDATVKEVLRLHPIFPAARRTLLKSMRLLGYELPAGTHVAPSIYLAHRRAEVFPEPTRFLPSRFFQARPTAFELLPFGGGMRRCVGGIAAPVQMKLTLATVLDRAVLQLLPGPPVRTITAFISLAPSGGVPAVLASRTTFLGRYVSI
jgi:cytochrome P450